VRYVACILHRIGRGAALSREFSAHECAPADSTTFDIRFDLK